MICFVVATPLQLFNSIIIMRHYYPDDKMDLFALNITCDIHSLVEKYRELDVVNEVYFFDDLCHKNTKMGVIQDYLFTNDRNKMNLINIKQSGCAYSDMFTTWVGGAGTWLYTKIGRLFPAMKLHFYEEGLGVYYRNLYSSGYNGIKTLYKILNYKFEGNHLEDIFVFQPDIYHGTPIPTKKIGTVTGLDIDYIRGNKERNYVIYKQNVLFFENTYENTYLDGMDERIVIDRLISEIERDNFVVRLHPISKQEKYCDCNYHFDPYNNIPWEDLLPDIKNLNDLILISDLSTAIFSPKLIYDLEPIIIITGKAIYNENEGCKWAKGFWAEGFSRFCYDIKSLYRDSDRVIIPNDYQELIASLRRIEL